MSKQTEMPNAIGLTPRLFPPVIAVAAWTGLVLQLVLFVRNFAAIGRPLADALLRYFSYFTVLTNLVVAVLLTGALLARGHSVFRRASVQSAAAAYLLVVMLVYFFLLRRAWNPLSAQFVADGLLHYAVPVLFALYWLTGVKKGTLTFADPFRWLTWPLAYFVYSLALGAVRGEYPYYFINAGTLGYPRVLLNALWLGAGFIAIGLMVVVLDRLMGKTRR
jgi:hypothetical protein